MTKWKSKIGVVSGVISATESESEESESFPSLPTPLTTLLLTFRLWSGENQIVGVGSRSGRIRQSECTFPCFVIGLVLLLLLPTPTIWFSLDHKRNVSDGVVNGIRTLFSLDHKLYVSDYDSDCDSVVSKNQPFLRNSWGRLTCGNSRVTDTSETSASWETSKESYPADRVIGNHCY